MSDADKTPVDPNPAPMDLVLAKLGKLERKVDDLRAGVRDTFDLQFELNQRLPHIEKRVTALERARVWLPTAAAVAAGVAIVVAFAAFARAALAFP